IRTPAQEARRAVLRFPDNDLFEVTCDQPAAAPFVAAELQPGSLPDEHSNESRNVLDAGGSESQRVSFGRHRSVLESPVRQAPSEPRRISPRSPFIPLSPF